MSEAYSNLVKKTLPKNFDWKYYIEIHPDLMLAGIDSEDEAIKHYVLHGLRENRIYCQATSKPREPGYTGYLHANKTIVNCYHSKTSSGIGDFLRGCLHLYEISEEFGFKVYISFFHHPIGKYITSTYNRNFPKKFIKDIYYETVEYHGKDYSLHSLKERFDYHLNQPNKNQVYISSMYADQLFPEPGKTVKQQFEEYSPSKTVQKLARSNIIFSKSIKALAKQQMSMYNLKSKNYNVIHLRLGDFNVMQKEMKIEDKEILNQINFKHYNINYENLMQKCIKISKSKPTIIMSDSNDFKNYIDRQNIKNLIVMHQKSNHCSSQPGLIAHSDKKNKIDDNHLKYVVLDLHLMSLSQNIHSFSVYPWGSGFSYAIAKIYNIPLKIEILE